MFEYGYSYSYTLFFCCVQYSNTTFLKTKIMNNVTSTDIVLSNYKSFEELTTDIMRASKNIPLNFVGISGNINVDYRGDEDEYEYNLRNLISIDVSSIEEAISELQKLSANNYTRITLDVTLEKSHNGPKELHTCIYSKGILDVP